MKLAAWTVTLLLIFICATIAGKTRTKRLVRFRKNSKFFLRVGVKDLVLNSSNIFAHFAGFKVTWSVPEGNSFLSKRPIRDLHDDIEFLFDSHGFDGKSCLLNNICQATEYVSQKSGVMAKILRMFLRYSDEDNDTTVPEIQDCDAYGSICPMDFIGIDAVSG